MTNEMESKKLDLILNNPKKAIGFLSLPIMGSLIFSMLNVIIDSAWVSALGSQPLAAVGFVTPLFMGLVGIGSGLGAGSNSLISRFIGANDIKEANNAAFHTIILSVIIIFILTVVFILFLEPILYVLGAANVMCYAKQFGFFIILGLFALAFPNILGGILRSEGNVKRATYPLIIAAIANMVLDPIFIFNLNFGISGAAIATVTSEFIFGVLPMVYWLFIKRDNLIKFSLKNFKSKLSIYKDILIVAIPASLEEIIMALLAAFINGVLAYIATTDDVAVFSAAWRIIGLGITPSLGVGMAAVTVIAASYGAKNWDNFKLSFDSACEFSLIFSLIVFVLIYIFAGDISQLFSFSNSTAYLTDSIADAVRYLGLYIIAMCCGVIATFYYQSIGKGIYSLCLSFLRELVFCVICVYLFAFVFNWGVHGVYAGIVLGAFVGSFISYLFAKYNLNKIIKSNT